MSKNFPFTKGGGGVPLQKFFFPVWTCIKPNLVSKIFPFTETRYPPPRIWDWVPPQIWDWVPPLPGPGPGTPLLPGPGPGTPPRVWTDKLKTVPSPILRMRAVKTPVESGRLLRPNPIPWIYLISSNFRTICFQIIICDSKMESKVATPVTIFQWRL